MAVLASILAVGLLTWFVAALGAYVSLKHFSTTRALTATLVALAIFNGYPLFLVLWFRGELHWHSSFAVLGIMPALAAWCLALPNATVPAWKGIWNEPAEWLDYAALPPLVLMGYAAGAAALTYWIARRFDRWLDRPPVSGPSRPEEVPVSVPKPEHEAEKVAV